MWPALIVFVVLTVCAIVVVAGYVRGNRRGRTAAVTKPAEPAADPLAATGSIQPNWDEKAAHTDSWIWR